VSERRQYCMVSWAVSWISIFLSGVCLVGDSKRKEERENVKEEGTKGR
jgi:hypothetical protein